MNWIMEHTVHKGFAGATVGKEVFTDLDYADDVALLAQMLEVLLLSLSVMNEEAKPLGLHINWSKTKIQQIGESRYSHSVTSDGGQRECGDRRLLCLSQLVCIDFKTTVVASLSLP